MRCSSFISEITVSSTDEGFESGFGCSGITSGVFPFSTFSFAGRTFASVFD